MGDTSLLELARYVAYVDPTSGGILVQLLLGGSALYLVVVKFLGAGIRRVFRRKPQDSSHASVDRVQDRSD